MRSPALLVLLGLTALACGGTSSSSGSDAGPDTGRDSHDIYDAPPLPEAGFACPSDPSTLVGQPCSPNGATCGACNDAGGFCNEVDCVNGTWTQVEVPGPPQNPPGCPAAFNLSYCNSSCSTPGLHCSYPATGDALFCGGGAGADAGAGEAGAEAGAQGIWLCGV